MTEPIPDALGQLVALNAEYGVLICMNSNCRHAIERDAILRHVRDRHQAPIELRKELALYIEGFPYSYNRTSVRIPADGTAPQPIIPVVDGFACRDCPLKSISQVRMRQHSNQAHGKKRVPEEEMFHSVQLQSWFGEKKERYWIVDKSKTTITSTGASKFYGNLYSNHISHFDKC